MWFRRWQGAVGVVDCRGISLYVGQFLFVRLINPLLDWVKVVSDFRALFGWGYRRMLIYKHGGRVYYVVALAVLNFLPVFWLLKCFDKYRTLPSSKTAQ